MQAYYEIETDIPIDHQLHLQLPDTIPAGRAKIAVIYELDDAKVTKQSLMTEFLNSLPITNTQGVSVEKIQNRIVAVGHDLENKKAAAGVYAALPACCHYREMETMMTAIKADSSTTNNNNLLNNLSLPTIGNTNQPLSHMTKGLVLEVDAKGKFNPLTNASVFWLGTHTGVLTDSSGLFQIKHNGTSSRLVISYTGFQPDTITVTDMQELKVVLASNKQLKEVHQAFHGIRKRKK